MRDKLIKILQDMGKVAFTNEEKADYLLQHDVVPVVRCKDCKYWEWEDDVDYFCVKHSHYYNSSHFCRDGERKE